MLLDVIALIFFKIKSLYSHPVYLTICENKVCTETLTCLQFYFHVYLERFSFNQISILCEMHMLSKKNKIAPFKSPTAVKVYDQMCGCVMSWCSIESLLNRDINFQQDQCMRFRPVQQDVEQWGGGKGKVCVRCFTGKRLLPLRPFTLTDCISLRAPVH